MCLIFSTLHSSTYEAKIRPHPPKHTYNKEVHRGGGLNKGFAVSVVIIPD